MIRAHQIRLQPTLEQEAYFRRACGTARFVFNWGLAEWKRPKAEHPGQAHGVMAIKKDCNALKGTQFPWVYDVAQDVAEGAFTNLAAALTNYFESQQGERQGPRVGFPKFKSKKRARQSFRLNNDKIKVKGHWLRVPKLGWVNLAEPLRFVGQVMGAVISQAGGHWAVSLTVEMEKPQPQAFAQPSVGVDVGIKTLAVLSDGTQYENQVLLRSELTHLKRLNRRLARRQLGSHRWHRAQRQLGRFHQRLANRRADCLHKMTTQIARTYALIGLEDLNVAGRLKNRRLALSLADAAFGEIRRQLEYQREGWGGQVIPVGRFYPASQLCFHCGAQNTGLELVDREWRCGHCGAVNDRDRNAAQNIEREALRLVRQPPVVATSGSRLVDGL